MRKSSNVRSAIVAPEFSNVKLYNDGFVVTVSLHISSNVYEHFAAQQDRHVIAYRGRFYLHWEKHYSYFIDELDPENPTLSPFPKAFREARKALKHLMIMRREAEIAILNREISVLKNKY